MTAGSIPAQDKITREKNERQDKVEELSCGDHRHLRQWSLIKEGNSLHIRDFFLFILIFPEFSKHRTGAAEGQKL